MATIIIPTALRQYTGQQAEVRLHGNTVDGILSALTAQYPNLRKQLYNESDRLRNFVNIYLNDEDVRYLAKGETPVNEKDTISIIPAIAGGRARADTAETRMPPVAARGNGHDETLSHEEIRRYSRH